MWRTDWWKEKLKVKKSERKPVAKCQAQNTRTRIKTVKVGVERVELEERGISEMELIRLSV